jgi:NodT family efflux transporter outer membrane factor (OMF) lipoprotein
MRFRNNHEAEPSRFAGAAWTSVMREPGSSLSVAASVRMRRVATLAMLCLAPALTGCFVDTEKPELAVDIPERYRFAPRAAETRTPALDWWRGFRSPELTVLIEEAQTSNLDIAVAVARIMQADAQARIAGAPLLPNVTGTASATRSLPSSSGGSGGTSSSGAGGSGGSAGGTGSGAGGSGGSGTGSTGISGGGGGGGRRVIETYRAFLSASYEVDFWGKNRAALLAAEENAVASRFARDVVALTTMASVANSYFQLVAAQDRLRLARDNLTASSRILSLIRERLAVGTASSLDVAQQEALVAQVRANIPVYEITVQQNAAILAVLVGRAPEHFAAAGGTLARLAVPRVTPGLPSELINQRPDIREAEARLVSANHSVESARAAFFPSIQLTGQTGFQSLALRTLFGPGAWFYTMTTALTQPIFDGGNLLGQLEVQQANQLAALQTYRKSVVSAFSDVEQALVALQQQTIRERLQSDAVKSSRTAFNISETRLREGTLDLITLLNTQQTLFTAQDLLVQARLARLLAAVSLFQALGGGWPPRIGDEPA